MNIIEGSFEIVILAVKLLLYYLFKTDYYTLPYVEGDLSPQNLIEHYGYKHHETHYITTEDGYILQYDRILQGINNTSQKNRPPVLLMHGLGGTGADFIKTDPKYSLGYFLADRGFDVWIANARGTIFSRNHTNLDPDENAARFFNFSWHEIGYYDIPNAIDYILNKTNDDSLYYIGHSQGTTAFLVFASTRPEYSSKVKRAALMAPVALMNKADDLLSTLARVDFCRFKPIGIFWSIVEKLLHEVSPRSIPLVKEIICFKFLNLFRLFGEYVMREFFPTIFSWVRSICHFPFISKICISIYTTTHPSGDLIDEKGFGSVLYANFPSSFATKQITHYGQVINKRGFVRYDSDECYHLKNISIPIAFYYGDIDTTTLAADVEELIHKQINHEIIYDKCKVSGFGHADFLYNKRTIERLYDRMITKMEKKV